MDVTGREKRYGGIIRHTLTHEDGHKENVAVNNLMAIQVRFAIDINANRFHCVFYLPIDFWDRVRQTLRLHGLFIEFGEEDEYGGVIGGIASASIQPYEGNEVLLYTPHNDTLWYFDIGDDHHLISKEEGLKLLGPNKGFDLILPYHPALGYAPPRLLAQWVNEGYKSAGDVEERITALPPSEKLLLLAHWEELGYNDSRVLMLERGLAAPEELLAIEGGDNESTHRRALPFPRNAEVHGATINGEFTILSNRE